MTDAFPDLSNVGFIHTANDDAQIPAALLDDILGLVPRELKTKLKAAITVVSFDNQSELNLASWRQTHCGGVLKARAMGCKSGFCQTAGFKYFGWHERSTLCPAII